MAQTNFQTLLGYDIRDVIGDDQVDVVAGWLAMAFAEAGYPAVLVPTADKKRRPNYKAASDVPEAVKHKAMHLVIEKLAIEPAKRPCGCSGCRYCEPCCCTTPTKQEPTP